MKPFICFTLGITLLVTAGYAARDVTCYEMIVPDTNTLYVEADAEIIPTLGIANLGDQDEPDSGFTFPVTFMAIDTYGKINGIENDTVFSDSSLVDFIAQGDSMEVEITPWSPEGVCHTTEPFVFYELIGLVRLGVGPTDTDDDPSNDTIRHNVTCLLSHDLGATDLWWPEEPSEPPDGYKIGDTLTFHAMIENFGFNKEYDIPVRMQVCDIDSNGVELWSNVQPIDSLDWRGNEDEQSYTTEVVFPPYVIKEGGVGHHITVESRTELVGDLCPDNDEEVRHPIFIYDSASVSEDIEIPLGYSLSTKGLEAYNGQHQVRFSVPRASRVKLSVFDVTGRLVDGLADEVFEPGEYCLEWNDQHFASGLYFIRLDADDYTHACKLVVVK
jgi:hypothetical protein